MSPNVAPRSGPALDLLGRWITRAADPTGAAWFMETIAAIAVSGGERALPRAMALVPRRLGKADIDFSTDDLAEAATVRPGFNPEGFSVDQVARIALIFATDRGDDAAFAAGLEALRRTAELGELVALLRGLPLYPAAPLLRGLAASGVRSAMRPVFEAVAHRNPYPREWFDQEIWNQMVLKALFIGATLEPIQGLDDRANPDLAATLVDYAHERWSAGRPVSPELWRCVGPPAAARGGEGVERALAKGSPAAPAAAPRAREAYSRTAPARF